MEILFLLMLQDPDAYDATEDEDEEVDIFAPEAASQQGMAGSGKQARGTQRVVQQQQQQGAETPSFQLSFEADGTTVRIEHQVAHVSCHRCA